MRFPGHFTLTIMSTAKMNPMFQAFGGDVTVTPTRIVSALDMLAYNYPRFGRVVEKTTKEWKTRIDGMID